MSTVPEAIVAAQVGLRVVALSVITNVCLPDAVARTDGESVVAAARGAEQKMRSLVLGLLAAEFGARGEPAAAGRPATPVGH